MEAHTHFRGVEARHRRAGNAAIAANPRFALQAAESFTAQ
jgi:hypothetical protein